jgi:hypothetical protein
MKHAGNVTTLAWAVAEAVAVTFEFDGSSAGRAEEILDVEPFERPDESVLTFVIDELAAHGGRPGW